MSNVIVINPFMQGGETTLPLELATTSEPAAKRYYKIKDILGPSSDTLDLTELELYDANNTKIPIAGIEVTWASGGSLLIDGVKGTGSRVFRTSWSGYAPTAYAVLDAGAPVSASGFRAWALYGARWGTSFTLETSSDGVNYEVRDTYSGYTQTSVGSNVWDTGIIDIGAPGPDLSVDPGGYRVGTWEGNVYVFVPPPLGNNEWVLVEP